MEGTDCTDKGSLVMERTDCTNKGSLVMEGTDCTDKRGGGGVTGDGEDRLY